MLWRYNACLNQRIAAVALWSIAVWLIRKKKRPAYLVAFLPAVFMTAVCSTYILVADECLNVPEMVGYPGGIAIALFCAVLFMVKERFSKKTQITESVEEYKENMHADQ